MKKTLNTIVVLVTLLLLFLYLVNSKFIINSFLDYTNIFITKLAPFTFINILLVSVLIDYNLLDLLPIKNSGLYVFFLSLLSGFPSGAIYTKEIFEKDLEASKETFRNVCLLWHELPTATSEDKDRKKASRGSKLGFVKLSFNFLQEQKLFNVVEERFYPTDRFRAIAENYFEEYKGKIFTILGGTDNA